MLLPHQTLTAKEYPQLTAGYTSQLAQYASEFSIQPLGWVISRPGVECKMSSPDVHIQAAGQKDSKTYFGVVIDPLERDTPVAYRIRDLELKGV